MMTEVPPDYLRPALRAVSIFTVICFGVDSGLAQIEPPKHCENPDRTEIRFKYANGDRMVVALERHKDPKKCLNWCVTGGAVFHVGHGDSEGRIVHAVVSEGELYPPGYPQGFWMKLVWQPPENSQPDYVIRGLGEAGSFQGVSNSGTLLWTAETTAGCARWPDGPNPITRPPVSESLTPRRAGSVEAIAPGPRISAERDRAVAVFDSWVPNPQLSPGAPMPLNSNGAARVIRGDPIPSPGVSPNSPMPLGSSSASRSGIGGGGTDGLKQTGSALSSSGFYGSYSPGGIAVRPPQNSSGIYGAYAPNNNVQQPVPSGSAVARPPMSSSGSSMSYTPKDNSQTVPSGSAVARPPMSSSGTSMSYTPKDVPQPSGGAVAKRSDLSNATQVDPGTKICKIRPIHRSPTTTMGGNMPTSRQLAPPNATVMKNTNNAASGAIRGTRLRPGDPK